jgi:hypothetical protein
VALRNSQSPLAAKRKRHNGLLAILKRRLDETTDTIGALEHLALRIFFMVELLIRLLKNR